MEHVDDGTKTSNLRKRTRQENEEVNGVVLSPNAASASTPVRNSYSSKKAAVRNPYSTAKKPDAKPVASPANDDDVLVVSPPPRPVSRESQNRNHQQQQQDDDDDDEVVTEFSNLTNANIDLIHGRPDCGVYKFDGEDRVKFCDKCYCVVCDKEAKCCPQWALHHTVTREHLAAEKAQKRRGYHSAIDLEDDIDNEDVSLIPAQNNSSHPFAIDVDIEDVSSTINQTVQNYYARNQAALLKARRDGMMLDADSSDDEWGAYNARPSTRRRGYDHHYSNDFNHKYGDGSGKEKGRSPKDMRITEVLAGKLMDALQLSEGSPPVDRSVNKNSGNGRPVRETATETFASLSIQRKERFEKSRMEGDISQLALHKAFFVEGVRIGWPFPAILPPQRQMAIHLIKALKNRRHVVVESPTGTGKSAAILCSVLAWQRFHAKTTWGKSVNDRASAIAAAASIMGRDVNSALVPPQEEPFPRIIYCSRTHSQVAQMVSS
jgi:hypothetical protein